MNYGTIISILNLTFWRKKNDHLSALEPPEFFVDDLKLWFTDIPRVFYWGFERHWSKAWKGPSVGLLR